MGENFVQNKYDVNSYFIKLDFEEKGRLVGGFFKLLIFIGRNIVGNFVIIFIGYGNNLYII